jgi:hypothetical protein
VGVVIQFRPRAAVATAYVPSAPLTWFDFMGGFFLMSAAWMMTMALGLFR